MVFSAPIGFRYGQGHPITQHYAIPRNIMLRGEMLYPLELWMLKRFCDRYELDYQEVDLTLTYWENMEHLQSLLGSWGPLELDVRGISEWESQMAQYLAEHFLENYIAHVEAGWTISEEVGEPYPGPGLFSLSHYVLVM